jgi:ABC-type glycerol-3-phosphate transport system substrate-binding protein
VKPIAFAAAVAVGIGLVGCSSGGGSDSGSRTVNFVFYGNAAQAKGYDTLFDAFHKEHPEITVKAQGIAATSWSNFSNTVATRMAGGTSYDVMQIATEGQRLFASKGLLEPLDSYIAKDKKTIDSYFADMNPNVLEWNKKYSSVDKHTYFMPGAYNTVGLYLNTDLFKKAGIPVPTKGWTWDEFKADGVKIKAATGAYLFPAGAGGQFPDVSPWLLTNNANSFNANWDKATFDSPQAIESATFVRSLVADGLSPKPGGTFDAPTQLAKGALATFPGGRWPTQDIQRLKAVDKTVIVPFPTKAGSGSPIGWDAWPILKGSKDKKDAWTLIKFLISKKANDIQASSATVSAVPARTSAATSAAFTDNAPQGQQVLVDAVSYATPIPSPDRGPESEKIILEAWLSAITGASSPKDALTAANKKLNALL